MQPREYTMSHCYIDLTNGHHLQLISGPRNGRMVFEDLDERPRSRITCAVGLQTITPVPAVNHFKDCNAAE